MRDLLSLQIEASLLFVAITAFGAIPRAITLYVRSFSLCVAEVEGGTPYSGYWADMESAGAKSNLPQ